MRHKSRKNTHKSPDHAKGPGKTGAHKRLKIDLFGTHAVQAAWKNPQRFIHALYITENALKNFDLAPDLKRPAPTIVSKEDLDHALPRGTVHQGIALSCQPLEETGLQDLIIRASTQTKSVFLILDQVTDPHNVGAILRSACVFGVQGVIMQKKHAPDLTGVLAKTACGAVEYIPVAFETNLSRAIESLNEAGFFTYGLDERGEDIGKVSFADKCALVLGAEGPGLRQNIRKHSDMLVSLPVEGPIESLNVSNAAAVALYALRAGTYKSDL